MPVADPDYQSANHHKYTIENRFYQWHLQSFLHLLYDMLEEAGPRSVLDAGCGEGFVVDFVARQDPSLELTGVDLSEGAIRYARERFGNQGHFREGSIYDLPFDEDAFDAVVCSEVLEHLDEPGRAVAELRRVARSHVLMTVPREPFFKWLNDIGRWLGISPDPGHVNFWTTSTFRDFVGAHFDEAGFDTRHVYQLALARV